MFYEGLFLWLRLYLSVLKFLLGVLGTFLLNQVFFMSRLLFLFPDNRETVRGLHKMLADDYRDKKWRSSYNWFFNHAK